MERVNRFKTIFILKWNSIGLSIASVAYGIYLLVYPFEATQKPSYDVISSLTSSRMLASALLLFGVLKLLFIALNQSKGKLVTLTVLIFLWMIVTVGFFLQHINGVPNAAWIYTGTLVFIGFGIAQRGNFNR